MLLIPTINWKAGISLRVRGQNGIASSRTARANNRETLPLPIKQQQQQQTKTKKKTLKKIRN